MTQLQALLMAAPGLAVLLLSPSLVGVRFDAMAHGLNPTALIRCAENASSGRYQVGTVRMASAGSGASAERDFAAPQRSQAGYQSTHDLLVRSQFLCDVRDTRAP